MDGTNSKGKSSLAAKTIAEVALEYCDDDSKPKRAEVTFADIAFQRD